MINKRHFIIQFNLECYLKFTIRKKFEYKFEVSSAAVGLSSPFCWPVPTVAPPPVAPSLSHLQCSVEHPPSPPHISFRAEQHCWGSPPRP